MHAPLKYVQRKNMRICVHNAPLGNICASVYCAVYMGCADANNLLPQRKKHVSFLAWERTQGEELSEVIRNFARLRLQVILRWLPPDLIFCLLQDPSSLDHKSLFRYFHIHTAAFTVFLIAFLFQLHAPSLIFHIKLQPHK